jgi:phage-related protein
MMKSVVFVGSSLKDLKDFPEDARREAGYQLRRVQRGEEPADWKPMATIGAGVREIRLRQASGAFRVIYVANVGERIFVLHAFQKKSQRTSQTDIGLAQARYRALVRS